MGHRGINEAGSATASTDRAGSRSLRALDLTLLVLALPVVIPVAALVSIGILLDSPGPLLHRVRRMGKDGNTFDMLKFRTMVLGSDGPPLRVHEDRRQTPFGRTLSRTRLNELPQLWNVLRGDMRLIGPRPEAPEFVESQSKAFAEVLTVPPGITGPAQLRFTAEAEMLAVVPPERRNDHYVGEILPRKLELDLEYVRRGQRLSDVMLLGRTFMVLMPGVGRVPELSVTPRTVGAAVAAATFLALFLLELARL